MIQRFDQIAVDLPEPSGPNPAAADEPQICAPGEIDPDMLNYFAKKLG